MAFDEAPPSSTPTPCLCALRQGRIVASGSYSDIQTKQPAEFAEFIGSDDGHGLAPGTASTSGQGRRSRRLARPKLAKLSQVNAERPDELPLPLSASQTGDAAGGGGESEGGGSGGAGVVDIEIFRVFVK